MKYCDKYNESHSFFFDKPLKTWFELRGNLYYIYKKYASNEATGIMVIKYNKTNQDITFEQWAQNYMMHTLTNIKIGINAEILYYAMLALDEKET